jgi:polyphosphate kinase
MKSSKIDQFLSVELSWIEFNARVLEEADDEGIPLIERLRFLGIFSNNLDEFFKVRVAGLQRARDLGVKKPDLWGFYPLDIIEELEKQVVAQQKKFETIFRKLRGRMAKGGVFFVNEREYSRKHKSYVTEYFEEHIRSHLVPMRINSKNPFPALRDNQLYLGVVLWPADRAGKKEYAIVALPDHLMRFIVLPKFDKRTEVMFLDDVIRLHLRSVFGENKYVRATAYTIKINRDAELELDDDLERSYIEKLGRSLAKRGKGHYVRLNFDKNIDEGLLELILQKTRIKRNANIIPGGRYHNKRDLMSIPDFGIESWIYKPMPPLAHPQLPDTIAVMDSVLKQDVLLQYPYHRFTPVIELLRQAAIDPEVSSIRISLYRIDKDSRVAKALINAAKNGKKVIAMIEARARFDEENNLLWGKRMEEAGVKVIYGVPGLKVHAKLILISKRIRNESVLISHIGTGNFNEKTAALYSDFSLLTANKKVGREIRKLFDYLENNMIHNTYEEIIVSPGNTRQKLLHWISKEVAAAKAGKESGMILKVNSLTDPVLINELYKASNAGVKIDLLVRGICCLIPGQPGRSENIRVISIVGRYLEHSRVFAFANQGKPKIFMGSADMMVRNLDYRVEVLIHVINPSLSASLMQFLKVQLEPTSKTHIMGNKSPYKYRKYEDSAKLKDPHETIYQLVKKVMK